jgi:hypothetical protein
MMLALVVPLAYNAVRNLWKSPMMRLLLVITLALAGLWGGYWFVGQAAVEKQGVAFLEQLSNDGWQVGYESLETHGFPSRFDTTVTGLDLADPSGEFGWQTPLFQLLALSYQPNKVIAVWPKDQRLRIGGDTINISSEGMRASATVAVSTNPAFETATVEVGRVGLQSKTGWAASADRALIAMRSASEDVLSYDAYLDTSELVLPLAMREQFDPKADLPASIEMLKFDAALAFDRPLDSSALTGQTPALIGLDLKEMRLVWGDLVMSVSGALTYEGGQPSGKITVNVTGWDRMVSLGVNAGLIHPADEKTWRSVGASFAQGAETVEVPLTIKKGQIWLGMFPIGYLPSF